MTKPLVFLCLLFVVFSVTLKAQLPSRHLRHLSDAPDDSVFQPSVHTSPTDYRTALQQWKTVAEVNQWIGENFRYEIDRAKQLAENSPEREKTGIYSPEEFYRIRKGVCLDLSRFAVETVNLLDTSKHVRYLMLEFEPLTLDGSVLTKHWAAIYQDISGFYIFADSKRPGYISGPYQRPDDFIEEYQVFRNRKVVSWKVLGSYQKKKRMKAQRQEMKSKN